MCNGRPCTTVRARLVSGTHLEAPQCRAARRRRHRICASVVPSTTFSVKTLARGSRRAADAPRWPPSLHAVGDAPQRGIVREGEKRSLFGLASRRREGLELPMPRAGRAGALAVVGAADRRLIGACRGRLHRRLLATSVRFRRQGKHRDRRAAARERWRASESSSRRSADAPLRRARCAPCRRLRWRGRPSPEAQNAAAPRTDSYRLCCACATTRGTTPSTHGHQASSRCDENCSRRIGLRDAPHTHMRVLIIGPFADEAIGRGFPHDGAVAHFPG